MMFTLDKKITRIIVVLIFIFIVELIYFSSLKKEKYTLTINSKEDEVSGFLDKMTLDEKIGQLLIVTYNNNIVDENTKNFINEIKPGGFILFQDNFGSYIETRNYISSLQAETRIPFIISIDQEGGRVQRLKYLNDIEPTDIPDMYSLGATNDKELAYNVGKVMAEEMRTIGINVVYAPVIDVFSNPENEVIGDRSFGSDPNLVSSMANSLAKGLEDNGVIATYKHFPGHGDTAIDSHFDLPLIEKDYNSLLNLELIPFKEAIKNGAKIIMVGHLALPNITGNNEPASLSKRIIDILKNDLKYQGLIITDALNMGALTQYYDDSVICSAALNAGNDLLLMPNDINACINDIKNNVSEERINESVLKILKFKYKYLRKNNLLDKKFLNSEKHKKIINQIKG